LAKRYPRDHVPSYSELTEELLYKFDELMQKSITRGERIKAGLDLFVRLDKCAASLDTIEKEVARFSLGPQASLEEMEDFESVCQQFVRFQEEMESVSKKFANIEAMAPLIEELSNKVSVFVSRCTETATRLAILRALKQVPVSDNVGETSFMPDVNTASFLVDEYNNLAAENVTVFLMKLGGVDAEVN